MGVPWWGQIGGCANNNVVIWCAAARHQHLRRLLAAPKWPPGAHGRALSCPMQVRDGVMSRVIRCLHSVLGLATPNAERPATSSCTTAHHNSPAVRHTTNGQRCPGAHSCSRPRTRGRSGHRHSRHSRPRHAWSCHHVRPPHTSHPTELMTQRLHCLIQQHIQSSRPPCGVWVPPPSAVGH